MTCSETGRKALRIFLRLRLSIHTFSAAICAVGEAARWRQFSEVREDQTCKSERIRVMRRSLTVTNTISKLKMRLSMLQLSIHGSMTNKDVRDDKRRNAVGLRDIFFMFILYIFCEELHRLGHYTKTYILKQ